MMWSKQNSSVFALLLAGEKKWAYLKLVCFHYGEAVAAWNFHYHFTPLCWNSVVWGEYWVCSHDFASKCVLISLKLWWPGVLTLLHSSSSRASAKQSGQRMPCDIICWQIRKNLGYPGRQTKFNPFQGYENGKVIFTSRFQEGFYISYVFLFFFLSSFNLVLSNITSFREIKITSAYCVYIFIRTVRYSTQRVLGRLLQSLRPEYQIKRSERNYRCSHVYLPGSGQRGDLLFVISSSAVLCLYKVSFRKLGELIFFTTCLVKVFSDDRSILGWYLK